MVGCTHEYVDQALGDRFELVVPLLWELRALFPCAQNIVGNHLELGVPLAAVSFQLVPREVLCEVYLRRLACVLHRGALTFRPHRTSLRAAAARPATSTRLGRGLRPYP